MKSDLPKVLHDVGGKPLVSHVVDAVAPLRAEVGVVIGRGGEQVKTRLGGGVRFFVQKNRRGSGDAVKTAAGWLSAHGGDVMVLCGDAPLIRPETVRALANAHRREKNTATLLTARLAQPTGYGRIRRGTDGRPIGIVEEKDASPEERRLTEINSGAYVFEGRALSRALARLKPNNAKGEYYLTDVIADFVRGARPVGAVCLDDAHEILGVNTRGDLAQAEDLLRRRTLNRLMADGVTVMDPGATYVDVDARVGRDTVIWPGTFLRGNTRVGVGCAIGPHAHLTNCVIGDGARVVASFAEDAVVEKGARVGPYARLRSGAVVGPEARVGNFVEIKKSRLARGVKAGHLAYLGDADIGPGVNIGAGVITCNYDGVLKHKTRIDRDAFIGSNANLVAPVRVGADALIGAGSTIGQDVPAGALALERGPVTIKPGWARKKRKELARRANHKNHG